jgi:putative transposase
MQNLKYKFRLAPNKEQESLLLQFCGSQRYVWNHFLNLEIEQYKKDKTFRFSHKNITSLPKLKKELNWLKKVPSTSLQQTLLYLNVALKQSFGKKSETKSFPKFKKKRNHHGSFSLTAINNKSLRGNCKKIMMPKIGLMNINMHRELPSDFKSCQVKQQDGKWFIVFTVKAKKKLKRTIKNIVGLDFNSNQIIVDSNGIEVVNPKYLAKAKQGIKKQQRRLSKKTYGSNNYIKQALKVSKVHSKISRTRKDFLDKVSFGYVANNDLICLEDLDIASMSKDSKKNFKIGGRMVQDAGWSMLRKMIEYKAGLYGCNISVIGKWFPSTQMCSSCGDIVKKDITQREHKCHCGLETTRDLNSALNIKAEGFKIFNTAGTVGI